MRFEELIDEASLHSALTAYCLENTYAARRIIDLSAEQSKDDSLYEAVAHLDKVADLLRRLLS